MGCPSFQFKTSDEVMNMDSLLADRASLYPPICWQQSQTVLIDGVHNRCLVLHFFEYIQLCNAVALAIGSRVSVIHIVSWHATSAVYLRPGISGISDVSQVTNTSQQSTSILMTNTLKLVSLSSFPESPVTRETVMPGIGDNSRWSTSIAA